ncbi:MAG: hypothetical protein WD186_01165 [Actinomycetota bacterium]
MVSAPTGATTVGELLDLRIRREVETYNRQPGPTFIGLVQPADSIRHSDGFRVRRPRALDAEVAVAAREAATAGMLSLRIGDDTVDLDTPLDPAEHDEILVVLERPVVAEL